MKAKQRQQNGEKLTSLAGGNLAVTRERPLVSAMALKRELGNTMRASTSVVAPDADKERLLPTAFAKVEGGGIDQSGQEHQMFNRGDIERVSGCILNCRRGSNPRPIRGGRSLGSSVNSRRQPHAQHAVSQAVTVQPHINIVYTYRSNTYCTPSPNMRIIHEFLTEVTSKYLF